MNLFKKSTVVKQIKSYPAIVQQVHNEFFTASDTLVTEAQKIINEGQALNVRKVDRLKSLGFTKASDVSTLEPLIKRVELSKEQISFLSYYRQNYPFNKFITEEQVKAICDKYNLVCGNVSRYKGFVPDKNLKEMESFKLGNKEKNTIITSNGMILENAKIGISIGHWHHIYKRGGLGSYAFQSSDGINFYSNDKANLFGYAHLGDVRFSIESNSFKICAPIKDMDISSSELKYGYKIVEEIPDPVVLQPVKGGYLIITAWGDEASDELVVNEKFN